MRRSDNRSDSSARAGFIVAMAVCAGAGAQPCEPGWHALGGVNGSVYAMTMWDPDGAGPRGPLLVVGGAMTTAGGAAANHIAAWDPATGAWSSFGTGTDGVIRALAVLPGGDLVAAGRFTRAGEVMDANFIARWDGERWHSIGGGITGEPVGHPGFPYSPGVYALSTLPGGDLVAGGMFDRAGGAAALNVARWDGADWWPVGDELWPVVHALGTLPGSGDLVAGYAYAGGISRWDGSAWTGLGGGVTGTWIVDPYDVIEGVWAMATPPGGALIVGGAFNRAGGAPASGIARWDGSAWGSFGGGVASPHPILPPFVYAIAVLASGDVVAGGAFPTAGGKSVNNIARWDGAEWHALGGGASDAVTAMAFLPSGDLAVGGNFTSAGGLASRHLAILRDCPPCDADCDGSGGLDFADFLCFQNEFAAGSAYGDCDESGAHDFFDFLCFENAFIAGCP